MEIANTPSSQQLIDKLAPIDAPRSRAFVPVAVGESRRSVFVQVDKPQPSKSYALPVDHKQFDRATSIKPTSMLRPHMRIFYLSWMSGITSFIGWYAIPSLMPVIKTQLGLTEGEVLNSDIASTASTIFSRIASGPQAIQSAVLRLGAISIFCAAFVNLDTSLVAVRFIVGLAGCIFFASDYWTTIMVRPTLQQVDCFTFFVVLPFVSKTTTAGGFGGSPSHCRPC